MLTINAGRTEKSDPHGDPICRAKDRVLEEIYGKTGLYLDMKGETSTNGPQVRRFFSEELAELIRTLAHDKHKDNLVHLHQQLSIVLVGQGCVSHYFLAHSYMLMKCAMCFSCCNVQRLACRSATC